MTELNVIAAQYREQTKRADATEAWTEMRSEWIDATVKRAVLLYEARRKFPDNQAFSDWLGENEIEIEKNTQAALIRMGEYPELTREGLEKTRRISLRLIWDEELENSFPNAGKTISVDVMAPSKTDLDSMTVSQRASIFSKLKTAVKRGGGNEAAKKAATEAGFAGATSAYYAEYVVEHGIPELIAAMDQGWTIKAAAAVAHLSVERQRTIMALPEKDRRAASTVKPLKRKKQSSEPVVVETKGGYKITKVGNTVVLPSTGLPKFSNAELGIPDTVAAGEPDPEQSGLTKGQGYVAKYGQGQLKTMRERKRSIVQSLGAALMKLDAPLTEFVETVLVTPAEVTELLSETNKPERTAERIKKGLDALRQNAAQLQQFITALDALLAGQPDRDEAADPLLGDDPVEPVAVATTQPVREQVLALAKQRGAVGVTRSDVLALFPRKEAGAKRLSELCREGYLIKTTKRRYNADGMPESVYVHREAQRAKPDQIVFADLLEATLH